MEATMPIVPKIRCLSKRLEPAQALVEEGAVTPAPRPDRYAVRSSTNGSHQVCTGRLDGLPDCTCPDFRHRGEQLDGWCKHRLAVELYLENQPAEQWPENTSARSREQLERELAELF